MEKKYKNVFKKSYIPKWISISAAFSYALALVENKEGVNNTDAKGYIDITSPLNHHNLPDATEMKDMIQQVKNEITLDKLCIVKTDEALLKRFMDGSITCQGQIKETRRVATSSCMPPYEYFTGQDEIFIQGNHELLPRHFWRDMETIIDYKKGIIPIFQYDPSNINEEIENDDKACFNIYGMRVGEFFIWKKEWINVEVSTAELLTVTSDLFDIYCNYHKIENKSDPKAPTGQNRFFYSKNEGCWIIEFEGKVAVLKYKPTDIIPRTVQYLIQNGAPDDLTDYKCDWYSLEIVRPISSEDIPKLKSKHKGIPDEESDNFIEQYEAKIDPFTDRKIDEKGLKNIQHELYKKKEKLKLIKENSESNDNIEELATEIKEIEKELIDVSLWKTTSNGKKNRIPRTLNRTLDKIRRAVRERLKKFNTKIRDKNRDLHDHLIEKIGDYNRMGLCYCGKEKWVTEDESL